MSEKLPWQPPENPDPHAILHEAPLDTRAGRYEDALAKLVWFFHNALKYERALSAVRLSFALGYWRELGKVYPPALDSLKEIRDKSAQDVMHASDSWESFHEVTAINRYLGLEEDTVRLFAYLDAINSPAAHRVYRLAQPPLIKQWQFERCGKYLDPQRTVALAIDVFRMSGQFSRGSKFPDHQKEIAEKGFGNDVQTLIGLLVVNKRDAEAREVANRAKKEWDNSEFHAGVDRALSGWIPDPWP